MTRSQRATFAGVLWLLIGSFLIFRGFLHWNESGIPAFPVLPLALGVAIGAAKGIFVLRKSSKRILRRIADGPERAPVYQAYPPFLLVAIPLMIGLGLGLRHFFGAEHPALILAVYAGIGAALLASSPPFFTASFDRRPS